MPDIIVDGLTQVWFLPAIAAASKAPTVAEITAGIALGKFLLLADSNLEGFEGTRQPVVSTKLASNTSTSAPGRINYNDPGFTLAKQGGTDTIFTALKTSGTAGFVVIRDGKPYATAAAAADIVDVYPVTIGGYTGMKGRGENTMLRYEVKTMIGDDVAFQVAVLA